MRSALRTGAAAMAVFAVASFAPILPAAAQKLPWSDANPLERLFGKPAPRKHQNRPHQSKRTSSQKAKAPEKASETAAVPVPGKRPEKAAATAAAATAAAAAATAADAASSGGKAVLIDAGAEKPTEAVTPAVPAPETVPKPAPSPASPVESPASKPAIDTDAAAAAAAQAAEPAAPIDPAATAAKPVDEIPVPDKRPPEPTAAMPSPEPAAPVAPDDPVAPPAATETVNPDPAPNSTDKLKSRIPTVSPAASVLAAAAVEDAESCEAELTRRGVEFTVEDSISEGECGVLRPIHVTRLASGVKVSPKTQMLCRAALALDDWMTNGVVPAAKADLPDRKLTEFRHASTYVCRPRASEKGISEHARGSAIDIAAFVFDKGGEIGVEARPAGTPEAKFQDEIRAAACGPFKTVLGPGTDSDHATHFHLDIAARNNAATYCK